MLDMYLYNLIDFLMDNAVTVSFVALIFFSYVVFSYRSRKYYRNLSSSVNAMTLSLYDNSELSSDGKLTQFKNKGAKEFFTFLDVSLIWYLKESIVSSHTSYEGKNSAYLKNSDIYKQIDSEYFEREYLENSTISFGSTVMVGLGVIGTFLGLIIGVTGAASGLASPDSNVARESLQILLSGAGTAFYTSLFGLIFSLLFNYRLTKRQHETMKIWQNFTRAFKVCLPCINDTSSYRIRENTSKSADNILELGKLIRELNGTIMAGFSQEIVNGGELKDLLRIQNEELIKQSSVLRAQRDNIDSFLRRVENDRDAYY